LPDLRPRRLLRLFADKHATKHFRTSGHPIIKSFQPGEDWGWCYIDEIMFDQL
jgi:hypothetical protein